MQNEVKKKLCDLKKRAMKRNSSFNTVNIKEADVENDFFEDVKTQIYAQIVRK